jgi:hypothetical protein
MQIRSTKLIRLTKTIKLPPQSPVEIGTRAAEDVADAGDEVVTPMIRRTTPVNRSLQAHRQRAQGVVAVAVNVKKCPSRTSS